MTRSTGIAVLFCLPWSLWAQGGDKELRANADALFAKGEYAAAFQPYQTLVGNNQQDFDLNFRYGVCALHGGADKAEAIKYLKRSTMGPAPNPLAWYFLGKAHHLSYEFKDALVAYERYRGTADKKLLAERPVDALELQCRNGQNLLSNLKEIDVHNKVEVAGADFFRFYDLSSIGGRIVVTPEELKSSADKKSKDLALVYLPDKGGPIYFASYGKGGGTGRDIYRSQLMPNGEFAEPVKLAGYINTAQDEDYPFMAPDGKSFYFCSKGHNSMGGYDVFKSTYDKGLDVFGAPVNMDFAVNTPDDDLLYLTDPEGKEACFASGRDSKQGMVHVYRVSTAQAPVNITVLKGTFASELNKDDRKAHILVQDALTQEQVADVRTDMNGNYVLSLPRSGKYRFMVEAGPSGRTHAGVVDVPRNDEPRAYRQELNLVDQGGEKLMIRNYFDQPLDEDMIALALDEIKRRAKLDVGTHAVVAEEKPVEAPTGDPLTRAGFAGDVTKAGAQRLADQDAADLRKQSDDIEHQSVAAYSLAVENAELAVTHTAKAEELVRQANGETDEKRKNDLMVQAARERQSARAANQRATAALRAGEELASERMATQLRAQKAEKLSTDLTRVMAGKDDNAMVVKLVELRTRMDEKNAPDGSITPAEKMRRMATEREKEAAAALSRANMARGEENELVDRIARKKREEEEAKGNKKENIARERAELEAQLQAMREENERAFAKARVAEQETSNARGQAALAKHLATAAAGTTANALNEDQKSELAQRISGTGSRITALAVDERYDAAIAMETRELERRTFDWGAPIDEGTSGTLASTRTQERDTASAAHRADHTTTVMEQPALAQGEVRSGGAVEAPGALNGSEARPEGSTATNGTTTQPPTTEGQLPPAGSGSDVAASDMAATRQDGPGGGSGTSPSNGSDVRNDGSTSATDADTPTTTAAGNTSTGTEASPDNGAGTRNNGADLATTGNGQARPEAGAEQNGATTTSGNTATGSDRPSNDGRTSTDDGNDARLAGGTTTGQEPAATTAGQGADTAGNATTDDQASPATGSEPSPTSDGTGQDRLASGTSRTDTDLASMRGVVTPPESNGTTGAPANAGTGRQEEGALVDDTTTAGARNEAPSAEELAFVQANELAELKQLRAAEKNRARRDSLDTRIATLEETMRAAAAGADLATTRTLEPAAGSEGQRGMTGTQETTATSVQGSGSEGRTPPVDRPSADGTEGTTERTATTDNGTAGGVEPKTTGTDGGAAVAAEPTANPVGLRAGSAEEASALIDSISSARPALAFDAGTNEAVLIADIYPDYTARKELMQRDLDDPKERSAALHGLELMLVDSIDAENARQLDHLERHPNESAAVLKRVDRLRAMKEEHVREADRALAAAEQEYTAGETRALEDAALAATPGNMARGDRTIPASTTPHNDDYVSIAEDREQVYTSTMDHRAEKIGDAIRERDKDINALADLEERIDSLEIEIEAMPMGKEQQKLRDKTDKLIDDHMILRTELGQRMGYISKKEFEAAQDSTKELTALNAQRGLAPNEPLRLLAESLEQGAQRRMDKAQQLRKQADRSEDIVLRDSLFRTAYAEELSALREIDRSHTVRNYLEDERFKRGEQLSYEQVEQRMFAREEEPLLADGPGTAERTSDGTATESGNATGSNTLVDVNAHFQELPVADHARSTPLPPLDNADASTLATAAQHTAERARQLEEASLIAADRADVLQDSAANAKRAQREELEREAGRLRSVSDSLHQASLLAGDQAIDLERKSASAQEAESFKQRLLKYYYLNDQDQAIVLNEEDRSRYFQAKAKALEQREEAVRDAEQATSTKQLADTLLEQSKLILQNPNANGASLTPEQMEQARLLTDQAVRLNHRADSLNRASERLNMAAGVNESQAASMLQALTPERGTDIMAMEQRTRRVESVLAQARSLQGAGTGEQAGTTSAAQPPAADNAEQGPVGDLASTDQRPTTRTPTTTDRPATGTTSSPTGQTAAQERPAGSDAAGVTDGSSTTGTIADRAEQPANSGTTGSAEQPMASAPDAERPGTTASPATPDAGAPRLLAPLTADVFDATAVAPRTGPIPIDAPMPAGVVYKVQIGAFKQDIPNELFNDLAPVTGERVGNGLTRYAVGMFTSPESAVQATRTVRERGYRDAFVVAYQDGRRVSLTQAMRAARPVSANTAVTADLPASTPVRIEAPSTVTAGTTPSDSALAAERAVLANYPASAEEVLAQFAPPADATAYYNVPGAAPARQVETVKGLFFTVQVGVYSKPTALDKLFNITPLNSERTENAKIRYTTGVFTDMEKARARKDQTVTLGVKDAFITAYLNGKRIPMRDARALINKFGAAVFADPGVITR